MEYSIYLVVAGLAGVFASALAILTWRLDEKLLVRIESWPRNRVWGLGLSLAALLWCVPYTAPIVFDWMRGILLPLAIGLAVAGYFLLDYLTSRAVAGLMILSAYVVANGAYVFHTPGHTVVTVAAWSLGVAGILVSARPCWGRDFLRCAARRNWRKYAWVVYFAAVALVMFFAIVSTAVKGRL